MPALAEITKKSQHSTWIEIRLDRLHQNLAALKKETGGRTGILAVIKANAYGHGLLEIAKALSNEVRYLGISSIQEALEIKEHQISAPLFLFGRPLGSEIPTAVKAGITLSISSVEEAVEIAEVSKSLDQAASIHVKVDTGMGRLGIPYRRALKDIEKIAALSFLYLEGIYTHFPTAEKPDGFATNQIYDLTLLLQALETKGITFSFRHASNSSGIVNMKTPVFNLARPGIMLYGIYPDSSLRDLISVAPILSLKSRIIALKTLQPGDSAGYGRDFVAQKQTAIAVLPIGYSHGYPFQVSNQAHVIYQGKICKVAGRVSMDYICVNVNGTHPKIGDEVILIGEENGHAIQAEELAAWAGTIPYEIVTRLTSRIPRLYQ